MVLHVGEFPPRADQIQKHILHGIFGVLRVRQEGGRDADHPLAQPVE